MALGKVKLATDNWNHLNKLDRAKPADSVLLQVLQKKKVTTVVTEKEGIITMIMECIGCRGG